MNIQAKYHKARMKIEVAYSMRKKSWQMDGQTEGRTVWHRISSTDSVSGGANNCIICQVTPGVWVDGEREVLGWNAVQCFWSSFCFVFLSILPIIVKVISLHTRFWKYQWSWIIWVSKWCKLKMNQLQPSQPPENRKYNKKKIKGKQITTHRVDYMYMYWDTYRILLP